MLLNKIKKLGKLNFKTILFNFHYLPFKSAIKFPVLICSKVVFVSLKGKLVINTPLHFGQIKIGYGEVGIFDKKKSRSIWELNGEVIFHGTANIGHGSKISVGANGVLEIGNNFEISAESTIVAFKKIRIGNDCLISWDVLLLDTDFHRILDLNNNILNAPKEIILGNKVWIGARSLILKGSNIPSNTVIAAASVISNILQEENSVYGGRPAKNLKTNIKWEN